MENELGSEWTGISDSDGKAEGTCAYKALKDDRKPFEGFREPLEESI